jgi:hypothetical protein
MNSILDKLNNGNTLLVQKVCPGHDVVDSSTNFMPVFD